MKEAVIEVCSQCRKRLVKHMRQGSMGSPEASSELDVFSDAACHLCHSITGTAKSVQRSSKRGGGGELPALMPRATKVDPAALCHQDDQLCMHKTVHRKFLVRNCLLKPPLSILRHMQELSGGECTLSRSRTSWVCVSAVQHMCKRGQGSEQHSRLDVCNCISDVSIQIL